MKNKTIEHKSLRHHMAFSVVLALLLLGIIFARRDTPTLIFSGIVMLYIIGNTALHLRRKDFRSETLYEYVLIGAAVLIVLLSSL